jgi:hypothetical protein
LGPPIELHEATEPVELPAATSVRANVRDDGVGSVGTTAAKSEQPEGEMPNTPEAARESGASVEGDSNLNQCATEGDASAAQQIVLGPSRGPLGQVVELVAYLGSRVFGAFTLIFGLSFLATYPVLQVFSLGYLLEAAARIGRSGRLRDAFPLVPQASKIGGALLGAWLVTLPWRYARDLVADSVLIDPLSSQTSFLTMLLNVLVVLTPVHIVLALMRGGRLRYFASPFNVIWLARRVLNRSYWRQLWEKVAGLARELDMLHYFYLGLRGGLGALAWLAIPSTLYAIGKGEAGVLGLLGGILLTIVVMYVPFLQVHFAVQNRFRAMFEVKAVRERFRRAPIAFFIAFLFTLVLVLPLYLLKIEVVPRDALWLPALVFIITIFPLKVMTGWAYGRAGRKQKNAHWILRIPCRVLMFPVALLYAIVVFFTQYTGWEGVRALYEHHAFLLPVPFSSPIFSGQ